MSPNNFVVASVFASILCATTGSAFAQAPGPPPPPQNVPPPAPQYPPPGQVPQQGYPHPAQYYSP
jgi:hypothetical protein